MAIRHTFKILTPLQQSELPALSNPEFGRLHPHCASQEVCLTHLSGHPGRVVRPSAGWLPAAALGRRVSAVTGDHGDGTNASFAAASAQASPLQSRQFQNTPLLDEFDQLSNTVFFARSSPLR